MNLTIKIRNDYFDVVDIYYFKHYFIKNKIDKHLYAVVAFVDSFERTFILTQTELLNDLSKNEK